MPGLPYEALISEIARQYHEKREELYPSFIFPLDPLRKVLTWDKVSGQEKSLMIATYEYLLQNNVIRFGYQGYREPLTEAEGNSQVLTTYKAYSP